MGIREKVTVSQIIRLHRLFHYAACQEFPIEAFKRGEGLTQLRVEKVWTLSRVIKGGLPGFWCQTVDIKRLLACQQFNLTHLALIIKNGGALKEKILESIGAGLLDSRLLNRFLTRLSAWPLKSHVNKPRIQRRKYGSVSLVITQISETDGNRRGPPPRGKKLITRSHSLARLGRVTQLGAQRHSEQHYLRHSSSPSRSLRTAWASDWNSEAFVPECETGPVSQTRSHCHSKCKLKKGDISLFIFTLPSYLFAL